MYNNPVKIIETYDYQKEVSKRLNDLHITNPVVITDPSIAKFYHVDTVYKPYSLFYVNNPNPDIINCQKAIDYCSIRHHDCVIAIGGGSVIDTAKVVRASLGTGITDINNLFLSSESFKLNVPGIYIPTTHGSGSEVTMWATVWDIGEKKKYSLSHPNLYAETVILDGSLLLSLPLGLSLTTMLDALSHSFEAIWNKNANLTSTNYAIEAICLILYNVDALKNDPKNLAIRKNLLRASNIAGLAFSNTKTAAAHSISYPLTMNYKIPHGIAASMTLLPLIKKQESLIRNELERIITKLGMDSLDQVYEKIKNIPGSYLKYRLKDWDVKVDGLSYLADESFSNDRINNNRVELSREDVYQILSDIY